MADSAGANKRQKPSPRRIILDTDPGIDDALAILLALGAADELVFDNVGWGDDELEKLVSVLEFVRAAETLSIECNPRIGRRGLKALAAALDAGAAPKLKLLYYDYPQGASAAELNAACSKRGITILVS